MTRPLLPVVAGPTASGKTAVAVALALSAGGEVVSADSMQIYRGMDILTAMPTPEEIQRVHTRRVVRAYQDHLSRVHS